MQGFATLLLLTQLPRMYTYACFYCSIHVPTARHENICYYLLLSLAICASWKSVFSDVKDDVQCCAVAYTGGESCTYTGEYW